MSATFAETCKRSRCQSICCARCLGTGLLQGSGMLPDLPAAICRLHCGGRCAVGSGGKSVGYLAHGTATDYMYDVAGVPISFTWEIFGDLNASFADCFKMFNPIDSAAVEATISNWAAAVLSLVELLPSHPDIAAMGFEPSSKVGSTASNRTALAAPRMITESKQPDIVVSAEAEGSTHDHGVHGGTHDAALQHSASTDSERQDNFEDGSGHIGVSGADLFHANKLPAILNWLYVLPVVILVLLVVLLKSARKGRTSWLRMRQRMI